MSTQLILSEVKDGIKHIYINRPEAMNALNIELLKVLGSEVKDVWENDSIIGAIITGEGDKAFAAGADIAEFTSFDSSKAQEMSRNGHNIFNSIESCPKPIIAVVHGFALGGGCELTMACHMRLASKAAKFGQPEVNLGLIPGYGGTQRLVQLIGKGRAMEMLLTGNMIDAETAESYGLVNHLFETKEEATQKATKIISKIASKGPVAIEKTIECVNKYFKPGIDAFEIEIERFSECFDTDDFQEGTKAFLEKRKPEFKGK